MSSQPHIVIIPGDVSVDVVEAVRMALDRLRPFRFKNLPNYLSDKSRLVRPMVRRQPKPYYVAEQVGETEVTETPKDKARRVKRELIDAGITLYGLLKAESRILPKVLHPNEHVKAIVYGQHRSSSVMLVATDERIIYVDKKPMAVFLDEVSYEVISGLEFEIHTLFATLILHTPVKNYDIRYANLHCASNFASHIEAQRLKREQPEKEPEFLTNGHKNIKSQPTKKYHYELKEDMAGYYWLPTEEEDGDREGREAQQT